MASADIMVNPSVTEAFGNVNLEAMASGLVVVSADVPSGQALIEHGRTGILVPGEDVAAYVRAVERLVLDTRLRKDIGMAAAAAAAGHRWSDGLKAVVDAYQLAGGVPKAPLTRLSKSSSTGANPGTIGNRVGQQQNDGMAPPGRSPGDSETDRDRDHCSGAQRDERPAVSLIRNVGQEMRRADSSRGLHRS